MQINLFYLKFCNAFTLSIISFEHNNIYFNIRVFVVLLMRKRQMTLRDIRLLVLSSQNCFVIFSLCIKTWTSSFNYSVLNINIVPHSELSRTIQLPKLLKSDNTVIAEIHFFSRYACQATGCVSGITYILYQNENHLQEVRQIPISIHKTN